MHPGFWGKEVCLQDKTTTPQLYTQHFIYTKNNNTAIQIDITLHLKIYPSTNQSHQFTVHNNF